MTAPSVSGVDWNNLSNAQIESYFGGQDDIKAARANNANFNLAEWYNTNGKNEVMNGTRTPTGVGVPAQTANNTQIATPALPNGATATPTMQTVGPGEMQSGYFDAGAYMAANPDVAAAAKASGQNIEEFARNHWQTTGKAEGRKLGPDVVAQTGTAQTAAQVDPKTAATYDATKIGNNTPQMEAAQGTVSQNAQVTAQEQHTSSNEFNQAISDQNKAIDATTVDPKATVQYQYQQLLSGDMSWAKGAIRQAEAALAARGMGGSSIAAEGISSAVLQAALPIAQQDAQVFQTMQLKQMDQKQALAVLTASHLADLDTTSLNNRQQAAVVNAQAFLQMDLANLENKQQANIINTQARTQTMLSDQAADNAAKQFNATSQNQMTQFYDQLNSNIAMYNTSQQNAMTQFNVGQTNAMATFNSQQQTAREQFSANLNAQIEQSNVNYLRQINTANTAQINQANYLNSQNLLQISNTAMANAVQWARDDYAYAWQSSENALNRSQNQALMLLNRDITLSLLDEKQKADFSANIGKFLSNVGSNVLNKWL